MSDADERAALEVFVGRTLQGRYRIDALLGMGGMGGVFRAHHLGLGQDVALKVLRPAMRSGEIATARFEREARSASRLDHPNCVRVSDFGELEDGTKFLVMQLLAGDELARRLGAPWPVHEAIDVALQILEGLAHAHTRGVVHRDLKPENVLLTTDHRGQQQIKLVDFGIAKLLESDDTEPRLTRTGMLFGTPRYMSPEQAGGGSVDARTDLYAVGLLLYEMLSGRPPFVADDVAAILRMHVLTAPPPLPGTVPAAVSAVVMRLLAKARADRFASAQDTIAALASARLGLARPRPPEHPHVLPVVSWAAAEPPPRRTFTRSQLLVGGVVLAVFWLGVAVYAMIELASDPEPTPTPQPVATPPAARRAPTAVVAPSGCRGDDCDCEGNGDCERECGDACELECPGSADCTFACGEDCEAECSGHSKCAIEVGPGSRVECSGQSDCRVACRGECLVTCHGKADCDVRCVGQGAPPPSECDRDAIACGRCP